LQRQASKSVRICKKKLRLERECGEARGASERSAEEKKSPLCKAVQQPAVGIRKGGRPQQNRFRGSSAGYNRGEQKWNLVFRK
jgi:hypothetical protein